MEFPAAVPLCGGPFSPYESPFDSPLDSPFDLSMSGGLYYITCSIWFQLAEAQETMLSLLTPAFLTTPGSAEAPFQTILERSLNCLA